MERRHGPGHNWSEPGPRLPIDQRKVRRWEEGAGDPANGETVPRCWSCGLPDQRGNRLTMFGLVLDAIPAGQWQLCESCYNHRNERLLDPDPLTVAR